MDDMHYTRLFTLQTHTGPALASWTLLDGTLAATEVRLSFLIAAARESRSAIR